MKVVATGIAALLVVGSVGLANAATCPPTGGTNQTSENFSAAGGNWATGAFTPGTVAGALAGSSNDLLITELSFTNNKQDFVEIYNPTAASIDLSNYYISDDAFAGPPVTGYWRIVLGAGYTIGTTTDFNAKFPAGATIAPGATKVIFMGAAGAGVLPAAGITADYEVASANAGIPDMVDFGNTPSPANGLLTNGGECVMLYKWDGACDLVCDVDYLGWGTAAGTASTRIDKSGISIDGIDGDAAATAYLNDTPIATQSTGQSHTAGNSIQRVAVGTQTSPGNGCLLIVVPTVPTTWSSVKSLYR